MLRIMRSPHTCRPILQEQNEVYGYWATTKFLTEEAYSLLRERFDDCEPFGEAEYADVLNPA